MQITFGRATFVAFSVASLLLIGTPALAHPDWTGLWLSADDPAHPDPIHHSAPLPSAGITDADLPLLTPKYDAIYRANRKALFAGDLSSDKTLTCRPVGVPLNMGVPYGGEILMTPGRVTIITEWANDVRRIFTDGRGHPDDLDPGLEGHSIGHWEGNDLIVDTVAISPQASLNAVGTQQSDKMHIVERFHEFEPGKLEISYHITDPEAFLKPYDFKLYWKRNPDKADYVHEYECDNNRDAALAKTPSVP